MISANMNNTQLIVKRIHFISKDEFDSEGKACKQELEQLNNISIHSHIKHSLVPHKIVFDKRD